MIDSLQMQSAELDQLFEALSKAQGEMQGAVKDSSNPFFKSQYADLTSVWEACRNPLIQNGLTISQVLQSVSGQTFLVSILGHSSGQWLKSMIPVNPAKADIQALGSAITYCRRYALAALVGVCPEDDDGEKAMDREKKFNAEKVAKGYKDIPCNLALPSGVNESEFSEYITYLAGCYNNKYTINQLKQMANKDMENFVQKFETYKKKKEEEKKKIESIVGDFNAFADEREGD